MNIKLRAVSKTVQQVVTLIAVTLGVYMLFAHVPADVLAIALAGVCLVGLLYLTYLINLDKLRDKQYAKLRSAESQRCEQELKDRIK
jgi:hypothetical protein